jgi:GNAT superfamily N-acetyltransferase
MTDDERHRQGIATQLLEYIANGAKDELGARVWYMRANGDMSWAIISQTLNTHGERHPKDGKIWTPSRCKTYFGEPPSRR